MLVLGLGTNIGDKLENLRVAFAAIKKIPSLSVTTVSPIYISDAMLPENAPTDWNMPYLNLALRCETTLTPHELLSKLKQIENQIGREPQHRHWGPREIDIDILVWDDLEINDAALTLPKKDLDQRPFALWPLADVAPLWKFPQYDKTAAEEVEKWGSRFDGNAPFHTRQIHQRIDTSQLVGVINATPDSFSDGGLFLAPEKALQQIQQLILDGAEMIDIGAESTAPKATAITPEIEWQRLEPILSAIKMNAKNFLLPPKISIDTRHAATAEKCLAFDVAWINDVTGLDNPAMRDVIKQADKDCVIMHHLQIPERRAHVLPRNQDPVPLVYDWCEQRLNELVKEGFNADKIIVDPGIGFGKMAEQSLLLLQQAHEFKKLGTRILIGHSRKTFMSLLTGLPFAERDIETVAITLSLVNQQIDYIRVHNVKVNMCAVRAMVSVTPLNLQQNNLTVGHEIAAA